MKRERHRAREAALQALYFWEVGRAQPDEALAACFREHQPDLDDAGQAFATTLVLGTVADLGALDAVIEPNLQHWRLGRVAVIDRLILRMATWELRREPETPAAVIIDEAIELARTFSSPDSVRFVNGVLDGIRKALSGTQSGEW